MLKRHTGLDTLRALAIALVFAYHYRVFVSGEDSFGWASTVGWVGVDLFFVLSGFLIADSLFAGLKQGRQLSLMGFYARRALRTLPVFWLVLALYFLLPDLMGGRTPPPLWRFLSFTQNIFLMPGTAFSHAWSLCIEEQFYLVLPLLLVAGVKLRANRTLGWLLLLALVGAGIATRALLWQTYGLESGGRVDGYYPNIYYATWCRADEFLPGVAVAMLKNFHPALWQRITRRGGAWLMAGVLAVLVMLTGVALAYQADGVGYFFFMTAFGYSLVAAAFALLVVAALCPGSWLARVRVPGAPALALWSYSIYLSHKAVMFIVRQWAATAHWPDGATLATITLASVVVGAVLYHAVEAPFMAMRQRHVRPVFRPT
jgi:peptidoglycan/LPS O-acetylase OafA/YrhL